MGGGGAKFRILGVGAAPNQCQTITFFTLKTENTAKLRIELKSIPLEITSNKIQGTYITLVNL